MGRMARGARGAVIALLATTLASAAAGVGWLHGSRGERWLAAKVVAGVNSSIAGVVEAETIEVRGLRWRAVGLVLRAPDGRVVATADRLDGLPLLPLLRRRIVLAGARITGLDLDATLSESGADVARAVARRSGREGGGVRRFDVKDLEVDGGSIRILQRRWPWAADTLALAIGRGWIGRKGEDAATEVRLEGVSTTPLEGPFRAHLRLARVDGRPARRAAIALADTSADVTISGAGGEAAYALHALALGPHATAALVPRWPLRERLALSGSVRRSAGGATVDVAGTLGATPVSAVLELRDGGGRTEVPRLSASIAGSRIEARGALGGALGAEGEARVAIPSLPGAAEALRGATGVDLGGVRGEGSLRVAKRSGGPLRVEGAFPELARGGIALRALRLRATVSGRSGELDVSAASLSLERRAIPDVSMRVTRAGDRLSLRAASPRLRLAAGARLRAPARAIALVALEVRTGGRRWTLASPARVTVGDGRVATTDVALRSGSRKLAVRASGSRDRVAVRVRASAPGARLSGAFALLPSRTGGPRPVQGQATMASTAAAAARLLGRPVRATGRIDAAVRVEGTTAAARGEARMRLHRLAARGGPGLDGTVTGAYADGTLRVDARLRSGARGAVEASLAARRGPHGAAIAGAAVEGRLAVRDLDASELAAVVPEVERAAGRIHAELEARGTAAEPWIEGRAAWEDGALSTRSFGAFDRVRVVADLRDERISASIRAGSGGGALAVDLEATQQGARHRVEGRARLERFPLVVVGELRARVDAVLRIDGAADRSGGAAAARVEHARIDLPAYAGTEVQRIARPDGIVVVERGAERPTGPREPEPDDLPASGGREWALEVVAPQPLSVRGPDLSLDVRVSPGFRFVWRDRLLVYGTLHVPSGSLDTAAGALAALDGTDLRFGGPPSAPFVDLRPSRSARPEEVRVHGRGAERPSATSELQLYSLLATGEARLTDRAPRPLAHPSVEGLGWSSALARYYAAQVALGTFLTRGVAASAHGVRTSVTGRVEIGSFTQLGADPAIGENQRNVTIGIRLAPRLRLESRFGDAGAAGLDLYWVGGSTRAEGS